MAVLIGILLGGCESDFQSESSIIGPIPKVKHKELQTTVNSLGVGWDADSVGVYHNELCDLCADYRTVNGNSQLLSNITTQRLYILMK